MPAGDKEADRLLQGVAARLGAMRRSLWHDDLVQAGRIALWRHADAPPGLRPRIARLAMIDELRRLTRCRHVVQATDPEDLPDPASSADAPERYLEARQMLESLDPWQRRTVTALMAWGGSEAGRQRLAARLISSGCGTDSGTFAERIPGS